MFVELNTNTQQQIVRFQLCRILEAMAGSMSVSCQTLSEVVLREVVLCSGKHLVAPVNVVKER